MKTIGVDLSHYQGESGSPIAAIVAEGAQFVIAKATGGTQEDPAWRDNKARLVHAPVAGAYCFVYGSIDSNAQADAFSKAVGHPGDMILVVDAEGIDGPNGKDLRAIGTRLRSNFGSGPKLWIYSSYGYAASIGNPDLSDVFDECWLANYVPTGSPPLGKVDVSNIGPLHGIFGLGTPKMRQFGPTRAAGLTLDTNVFFGSLADLKTLLALPKPPVPIVERKNYRLFYNAELAAARQRLLILPPPKNDPTHPAIAAGIVAGRQAAIDALDALVIADPTP